MIVFTESKPITEIESRQEKYSNAIVALAEYGKLLRTAYHVPDNEIKRRCHQIYAAALLELNIRA